MSKILKQHVTAHNPETGESKTFAPGEDLPSWALKAITNPDVFKSDEPEADPGPVPGPSQGVPFTGADVESEFGSGSFRSRSVPQVKALAASHGLNAETKDEAIAALEAEGIDPDANPVAPSTDTTVEG